MIKQPTKKQLMSLLSHLALFVIVEILFVFIVLQELPSVSLFSLIGIVHLMYWISLIVAGITREYCTKLRQKFLCSYGPLVFHVLWHIFVGLETLEHIAEQHDDHDHSIVWMIIATISVWIILFLWEYLLHRKTHCEVHHDEFHKGTCEHDNHPQEDAL